ncbi:hypothetical protein ACFSSA_00200 [Luteolibacter algae]|uniref:Uncharacterized protein n=1 Tax=Luteolibacter algae TaxID=454151 RepID=A0ABW5D208_9BACT
MKLENYMSWEGGIDVAGLLNGAEQPNVIVHLARMVHTPVGSAPAGMVLIQSNPDAQPEVMGFVSPNPDVAAYFGPKIFANTPFEHAPSLEAEITIDDSRGIAASRLEVAGRVIECTLSDLGSLEMINREPAAMSPFHQQVLEAAAASVEIRLDGNSLFIQLPPQGLSGGPAAVYSPAGIYSR